LTLNRSSSVREVAEAIYGSDGLDDINRARALLHQMRNKGKARLVPDGPHGTWQAVPPEEQAAELASRGNRGRGPAM
jgi:hypothetical protein